MPRAACQHVGPAHPAVARFQHKVLDCEQRVTQETQELISALDEEVEEREGEEEDRPGKKVSPHAPLTALKVCIADTEVKKEGEEGEEE